MPRITVTIAILLVSSFGLYSTQSKQLGEIDKRLIKYYAHKVGHTIFFKKISNPQGFNFRLFFIHDIEEARKRGEPYNGDLRLNRIVFTAIQEYETLHTNISKNITKHMNEIGKPCIRITSSARWLDINTRYRYDQDPRYHGEHFYSLESQYVECECLLTHQQIQENFPIIRGR